MITLQILSYVRRLQLKYVLLLAILSYQSNFKELGEMDTDTFSKEIKFVFMLD